MNNDNYELSELTEEQFTSMKREWQACLNESSADPIFSSWSWVNSWWRTWSEIYDLSLLLVAIYSEKKLVCIAPMYSIKANRKFGPSGPQLQIMGNAWRIGPTVRSEYTNFIIASDHKEQVTELLTQHLSEKRWDDFVISDHVFDLSSFFKKMGFSSTVRRVDRGVYLDVTGKFEDWIKSLGKNTRLKVFNRRNYLGDRIEITDVPHGDQVARNEFFENLSTFNYKRYQQTISAENIHFHNCLSEQSDPYIMPVYSYLKIDGEVVSIAYDIIAADKRYNLMLAFVDNFDKKVSLGLLHIGFLVEQAFENPQTQIYDFLAGIGKKTFYKERLKGNIGHDYDLITSQVSNNAFHFVYLKSQLFVRKCYSSLLHFLKMTG